MSVVTNINSEKSIYNKSLITRKIQLDITNIGSNLVDTIKNRVVQLLEGKCVIEGYIRPDSVQIQHYSSGELFSSKVLFDVVIECDVCCPVEGMEIQCIARNITKAGIRAEIKEGDNQSPVIIFLARDHHTSDKFTNINVDDVINVSVIGTRYELNDKYVSVIAELV